MVKIRALEVCLNQILFKRKKGKNAKSKRIFKDVLQFYSLVNKKDKDAINYIWHVHKFLKLKFFLLPKGDL